LVDEIERAELKRTEDIPSDIVRIMPEGSTRELAVLSVIQRRHREEQA